MVRARREERFAYLRFLDHVPPARQIWMGSILRGAQLPYGISTVGQLLAELGVELRVPFLDARVVRYFLERPSMDRAHPSVYKSALRAAAWPWLPPELVTRREHVPFSSFFARVLAPQLVSHASYPALSSAGLLGELPPPRSTDAQSLRSAYAALSTELQLVAVSRDRA
jgi:hypothetical protein